MRNDIGAETKATKPYEKPTLSKGPVLTEVAASVKPITFLVNPTPICWIARAAFGEGDIRWMIFRAWLLDDAPAWFRNLYIRYGEAVGSWLTGRDSARQVVRRMMIPAVRYKLRG